MVRRNADFAPGRREFHGIIHQIADNLSDPHLVSEYRG